MTEPGPRTTRMGGRIPRWVGVLAALVVGLGVVLPGTLAPSAWADTPDGRPQMTADQTRARPAEVVFAVDLSQGLTEIDVEFERQAVIEASLAVTADPRSTVSVVGYFGADSSGEPPVEEVCSGVQVALDGARSELLECVDRLRPRSRGKGPGADLVAALTQALKRWITPSDGVVARVIILIAARGQDDSGNARYGDTPSARRAGAEQVLREQLARAARLGVQIRPVGFNLGSQDQLDGLALGEAPCGSPPRTATPRSVAGPVFLQPAVASVVSESTCQMAASTERVEIHPGKTVKIPVRMPDRATSGSIVVTKGHPAVKVTFRSPSGDLIDLEHPGAEARVALTGYGGQHAQLIVAAPAGGNWTVEATSPAGTTVGLTVTGYWHCNPQAFIRVASSTEAGDRAMWVDVIIEHPGRTEWTPEDLRRMRIQVIAGRTGESAGESVPEAVTLPFDPGRRAFSRQIPWPGSAGAVAVASVRGSDFDVQDVSARAAPDVEVELLIDLPLTMSADEPRSGSLRVQNDTEDAYILTIKDARLQGESKVAPRDGPGTLTVASGTVREWPFTWTIDAGQATGTVVSRLLIVQGEPSANGGTAQPGRAPDAEVYVPFRLATQVEGPLDDLRQKAGLPFVVLVVATALLILILLAVRIVRRHWPSGGTPDVVRLPGMPAQHRGKRS